MGQPARKLASKPKKPNRESFFMPSPEAHDPAARLGKEACPARADMTEVSKRHTPDKRSENPARRRGAREATFTPACGRGVGPRKPAESAACSGPQPQRAVTLAETALRSPIRPVLRSSFPMPPGTRDAVPSCCPRLRPAVCLQTL